MSFHSRIKTLQILSPIGSIFRQVYETFIYSSLYAHILLMEILDATTLGVSKGLLSKVEI